MPLNNLSGILILLHQLRANDWHEISVTAAEKSTTTKYCNISLKVSVFAFCSRLLFG